MSNFGPSRGKNSSLQEMELEFDRIKNENLIVTRLLNEKENTIQELRKRNHIIENEIQQEKIRLNNELDSLHNEYFNKKQHLDSEIKKVKEEKIRYTKEYQDTLKTNSSEFVKETVKDLENREKRLSEYANWWSISGASVLFFGLILTVIISFWNSSSISSNMSWPFLIFFSFKGLIVLTVVGFFTRYNFVHSGNYMQESLKVADRIHAIKFGQFYIETYGATATWEEVKEVFSSWNGGEKTKWEKNIQYEEFNNVTKTLYSAIDKLKIQKDDMEEKEKQEERAIKQTGGR